MFEALLAMQTDALRFCVDVIDIDSAADPALLARFDELVPVLFGALDAPELCHYHLDARSVQAYIAHGQAKAADAPVAR